MAPVRQALKDAGVERKDIDEVVWSAGRRACQSNSGARTLREGAAQGRQPRRVVRSAPVRAPCSRRREGRAAPRRHRSRSESDARRRDDRLDPAQHHHSREEERHVLHSRRQPDERRSARAAGRASAGARQPHAGTLSSGRDPAGAARCAADRGDLRRRFERHRQRVGEGSGHAEGTEDHGHRIEARLSKNDVERLVSEAQSHADDDQKRRELVDARNEADASRIRGRR